MTTSGANGYPFLLQTGGTASYDDGNDFLANSLNTPDIVEMIDSFHPPFHQTGNEKELVNAGPMLSDVSTMYLMDGSQTGISGGSATTVISSGSGVGGTVVNDYSSYLSLASPSSSSSQHGCAINNNNGYYERKSYSPMLESAEINLENMNSPEMVPVSPNKVCPQSDYSYQFDGCGGSYQILESAAPIKSEYEQMSSLVGYLSDRPQSVDNLITLKPAPTSLIGSSGSFYHHQQQPKAHHSSSPHSPASTSSGYSTDSAANSQQQSIQQQVKTFATLDNVLPGSLKQEPIDSIQIQYQSTSSVVPTVVDETITSGTGYHHLPTATDSVIYNLNTATTNMNVQPNANYYYVAGTMASPSTNSSSNSNSNPKTGVQMVVATAGPSTSSQPVPSTNSGGRKRTAGGNAAGYGMAPGTSTGPKKQRMSKREKQKMMESQIEHYERENKHLSSQIELLEKQINFCKKYLSENVAPYIQKQQQQQQPIHHQLQSFVGMT